MTFPQQPQYPQQPQGRPQGPAPQYQPNGPQSQYPMQPMPQYPQPPIANRNPFFEWLKQARRDFSRIGASLCLMVVVWYALATVLEGALYAVVGGKGETPNWVTYVGSGVPLYLIAMPIAVMLMGKSTVIETRKFDMKPGLFFKLLLMCLPMMWAGSVFGSMLSMALSNGEVTDRVADLAMQTNIWNVVFLVIVGPIFEEWLFRKQLIDHTRKYGEKTAILLSGLAFGLFHMNLFQFFYAFLLGAHVRLRLHAHQQAALFDGDAHDHQLQRRRARAMGVDTRRSGPAGEGVRGRGKRQCGGDGTVGVAECRQDWRSCLSISCCTAL